MQKITTKLMIIGAMCLLFVVGMFFIRGLVSERQAYHTSVIDDIKSSHIRHQHLITPFLVIGADTSETLIFPNHSTLNMATHVRDDEYSRGIYQAISYQSDIKVKQNFDLPKTITPPATAHAENRADISMPAFAINTAQATPKRLTLFISASDLRGLTVKNVVIDGTSYPAKFAKDSKFGANYLAVDLSAELGKASLSSDITLSLSGIDSLSVLPLGADFHADMVSNWHEPKFFGQTLPMNKTFQDGQQGFSATWQGGFVANQNEGLLLGCANQSEGHVCPMPDMLDHGQYQTLATAFVQTSDTYTLTDRSIKYALLIIMVSFGTFFLFEIIKARAIHPIQYLLVGSALMVFYLLLLSLAEQIAFLYAYIIASVACVGLIGWYACYMLGSVVRGMGFGVVLGSLYTAFYVILSASGLNLLLGSVFCFVFIAVVMVATRHVDWYGMNDDEHDADKDGTPKPPTNPHLNQSAQGDVYDV